MMSHQLAHWKQNISVVQRRQTESYLAMGNTLWYEWMTNKVSDSLFHFCLHVFDVTLRALVLFLSSMDKRLNVGQHESLLTKLPTPSDNAAIITGYVHNQKSDLSRFVRQDRSSPMKKNAFIRYIIVTHTIMSLYPIIPQSLWLGHLKLAIGMRHGRDCREVRFFSEESKRFARIDRIDWIFDYECNHCFTYRSGKSGQVRIYIKLQLTSNQVRSGQVRSEYTL